MEQNLAHTIHTVIPVGEEMIFFINTKNQQHEYITNVPNIYRWTNRRISSPPNYPT